MSAVSSYSEEVSAPPELLVDVVGPSPDVVVVICESDNSSVVVVDVSDPVSVVVVPEVVVPEFFSFDSTEFEPVSESAEGPADWPLLVAAVATP